MSDSEIRPYKNLSPAQAYELESACNALLHAALWLEREAESGGRVKAADCRERAEGLARAFYCEIKEPESEKVDPMDALQKANKQARAG
jgi:hypothetical protein